MMENLRDAEDIDFSLQNALIGFSDVADQTLERVQQLVRRAGLKATDPKELEEFNESEESE